MYGCYNCRNRRRQRSDALRDSYATSYGELQDQGVLYLRLARVCPIIVGQCNGPCGGTGPDVILVSSEQPQADIPLAYHAILVYYTGFGSFSRSNYVGAA